MLLSMLLAGLPCTARWCGVLTCTRCCYTRIVPMCDADQVHVRCWEQQSGSKCDVGGVQRCWG
jgi:hypothetical protein